MRIYGIYFLFIYLFIYLLIKFGSCISKHVTLKNILNISSQSYVFQMGIINTHT